MNGIWEQSESMSRVELTAEYWNKVHAGSVGVRIQSTDCEETRDKKARTKRMSMMK
jgi:hypothetical protein